MIGINHVVLVGVTRDAKTNAAGAGRFWLDTNVEITNKDGEAKTLSDSVVVFTPTFPKGQDGKPAKDGTLVMVVGELANVEVPRKDAEPLKFVQVVAHSISRVEKGTAHINRLVWAAGLGADPEMRYTSSGTAVTEIRLVVGGNREKGESGVWLTGTAWRGQAEFLALRAAKGARVTVEGRVYTEDWTSRDGTKSGRTTRLHVNDVLLGESSRPGRPAPPEVDESFEEETAENEIPF